VGQILNYALLKLPIIVKEFFQGGGTIKCKEGRKPCLGVNIVLKVSVWGFPK